MKHSLKKDSLSYHMSMRPAIQFRDMSSANLPDIVLNLNKFMSEALAGTGVTQSEPHCGHPERDAVTFYMLNHAVSVVRQNTHPMQSLGKAESIIQLYHDRLAFKSARMFFYLLLICTRESRHVHDKADGPLFSSFKSEYGQEICSFHGKIRGTGSSSAADRLRYNPPVVSIGPYTRFLSDVFHKGHYAKGYGGPAWGAVADVLRDFVHGKITAEMMMDTAFTLCHNNGPIFNKGMLFDTYSSEIYKILDVQRSGQIPALIHGKETKWANDTQIKEDFALCRKVLGEDFGGYVDWYLVEELGAMKTYPNEKKSQVAKHGYPSKYKAKLEAEKLKKELEEKLAKAEAAKKVEIMPGLSVLKVEVER